VIIRVFRARTKPGAADELTRIAVETSIPFVDRQPGLVARHTGRSIGATGEELVMITVWEDLDAMKNMTGDEWEKPVIPDERMEELIDEMFLQHYETIG
jgi:heme-degrading monooxygenase HmoA